MTTTANDAERGRAIPTRLISVCDAAERLGIGQTKARELVASGELATIRIGRRRLVPESSIAEFIAEQLAAG